MISLCCFSAFEPVLEWTNDTRDVELDSTVLFGFGWDWEPWDRREEAVGPNGNYALWRQGTNDWWLYRDSDGAIQHSFETEERAKLAALRWCLDEVAS